MTPEELSRIRRIYQQALPLDGSARETFSGRNVRARTALVLRSTVWGPARAFAALDSPTLEGRQLSGYTLIREIGRGGMGSVYLAERSDDMFHRQAAVKLILPPTGSAGIVARFQQSAKSSRRWTIRISPSCSMPALPKRAGRISSWSL